MGSTRRDFFHSGLAAFAASTLSAPAARAQQNNGGDAAGNGYYLRLILANDRVVSDLVNGTARTSTVGGRGGRGQNLQALVAAYAAPESIHHRSAKLVPLMESAVRPFLSAQHADGTIDAGNLSSPPDTGFVVGGLATALAVLRPLSETQFEPVKDMLRKFLLAAGEALVTGGVHTPNHRWVVCSALARIHSLFPSAKYVQRIDDWLGEGVYIDQDGQFEERSAGIYSRVTDDALLTMARLLGRPELLDPVRRNLEMTLFYAHPDGELETVASRRQDAGMILKIGNYYVQYRYLAIRDGNPRFAAITRFIEAEGEARLIEGSNPLISFLEDPLLKKPLPGGGELPSSYAKVFPGSGIARIRRGAVSATVFGGSDWPAGVGSGLSSNPTFFRFRKGKAILDAVRMGSNFFSEGAFRSEGLEARDNQYRLHQRFDVPYYQPLPRQYRNARGDYPLTPARDFRFWSKLDFPHRQMSNVQSLDQKVDVVERDGAFELGFDITGHDQVPFTIELAFRTGGEFEGPLEEWKTADGQKVWFMNGGAARYRVGSDAIEFGPGEASHRSIEFSGPSYTAHGGTLRAPGHRVYITGYTPFRHVVTIRAARL